MPVVRLSVGVLMRGALPTPETAPIAVNGRLVFMDGATLAWTEEKGLRANGRPLKVATAAGGIEGLPVVADPRLGRTYRFFVEGNDLLLDCSAGTLLIFR